MTSDHHQQKLIGSLCNWSLWRRTSRHWHHWTRPG